MKSLYAEIIQRGHTWQAFSRYTVTLVVNHEVCVIVPKQTFYKCVPTVQRLRLGLGPSLRRQLKDWV